MPIPILLITGFLGAGKTTLINRLLSQPQGRRLAAIVNDFGAINIDAALLGSVSDDVIDLRNGCICCNLLGDLLQTISVILRRTPAPDGIVIETSGISDPGEIVRTLLDPVIWKEAALDTVICVADARTLTDRPGLLDDALWRSQSAAADFIALSKTDLLSREERDQIRTKIGDLKADHAIYDMVNGELPTELHFSGDLHHPPTISGANPTKRSPAFQTVSWTSQSPLVMSKFRDVMELVSSGLVRAKGLVIFAERPDEPMLFQLVGTRATISRAPAGFVSTMAAQIVFIARHGTLDEPWLLANLTRCRSTVGS